MKKIVILLAFALCSFGSLQAQDGLRLGGHLGIPVGDAGDFATFAIAVDLGYLFDLSDQVQAGPTLGYSHSFGDEIDTGLGTVEIDDVQFIPLGGQIQWLNESVVARGQLGYAIGVNDGNDGGFYYSPQFGYRVSEDITILAGYRGVSLDGGSWDLITLGVEFGL